MGSVSPVASEDNPVSTARNKITEASGCVVRATDELRAIADALFGELPPVPCVPGQPPRSGELGILHDKIDELHGDIGWLETQIARFDSVNPNGKPATTR